MSHVKRIIFFVIALLIVFATVIFVLENKQAVSLVFLGWSSPELPVAVSLILVLLIGMAIGPLLAFIFAQKKKKDPGIS
ncbi:MAG: lipopolysaccharide assembly protein LapA domain-containing protein [Pyrinomonadaceae bacterium]